MSKVSYLSSPERFVNAVSEGRFNVSSECLWLVLSKVSYRASKIRYGVYG